MWVSRRGGSPGEPPTPEQLEQWRRRMSPPEYEFPAGVGLTVLLGRTDDAAVGLTNVEAFSTGFRFALAVRRPHVGRPRAWSDERVTSELSRLVEQLGTWPRYRDFEEAEMLPLYAAIARTGGLAAWRRRIETDTPGSVG